MKLRSRIGKKKSKKNEMSDFIVSDSEDEYVPSSEDEDELFDIPRKEDEDETTNASTRWVAFIQARPWFRKLNQKKKNYYAQLLDSIATYLYPVPTFRQILDMKTGVSTKARLIRKLTYMGTLEPYSGPYTDTETSIVSEYNYYQKRDEQEVPKNWTDPNPLKTRIFNSSFSDEIKQILYKKYTHLENLSATDADYKKLKDWFEVVLSLPVQTHQTAWGEISSMPDCELKREKIRTVLEKARASLDKHIYGMNRVKYEIITQLATILSNPSAEHNILALSGAYGVGKTSICLCLSEALGIPMEKISLGGMTDPAFIKGFSYTYVGAGPGEIVKALNRMQTNMGIILLDEIDKIRNEKGQNLAWSLIDVIDRTQNKMFKDDYMTEIPIDLSRTLFVASMNKPDDVDPTVRDRLYIVEVPGYGLADKMIIAKKYLLPKFCKTLNISLENIIIEDDALRHMITQVCAGTEGVRDLERVLFSLVKQIHTAQYLLKSPLFDQMEFMFTEKEFQLPMKITDDMLRKLTKNMRKKETVPEGMYL